ALAVAIPVRGATEGEYIRWLTDTVNAAALFEMPVFAHVYPRDFSDGGKIVFTPDEIAYAHGNGDSQSVRTITHRVL
ncbi:aldolase, partial [Rhizobium ruizarguesonis]